MKYRNTILLGFLLLVPIFAAESPPAKAPRSAKLLIMTWFHPILTPGISEILLLCTVSQVGPVEQKYGNDYWPVILRIDERMNIDPHYRPRLAGIDFLEVGDFRKRCVGEQIVLFAGWEPYFGEDFLMPCWSGTETDLGILLHPKDDDEAWANEDLLTQLRAGAQNKYDEPEFYQAFAHFCPKGVAKHLIARLRREKVQHNYDESRKKPNTAKPTTGP